MIKKTVQDESIDVLLLIISCCHLEYIGTITRNQFNRIIGFVLMMKFTSSLMELYAEVVGVIS